MKKMTKEEFKAQFIEGNGMTEEEFDKVFVVLPCVCEYQNCPGWSCVPNEPEFIERHNSLFGEVAS